MLAALEVSHSFVVTMSQYRNVFATNTVIEMAGLCTKSLGPVTEKQTNNTGHPRSFYFESHFGPHSSPGLTHITHFAACVTGFEEQHGTASALPAPTRWKHHQSCEQQMCVKESLWMERNMSVRKKLCWTTNNMMKENNIKRWKQLILTFYYGVKNLCPLFRRNRTAKSEQMVTCRVDRLNSTIVEKVVWNKKQWNWRTAMEGH